MCDLEINIEVSEKVKITSTHTTEVSTNEGWILLQDGESLPTQDHIVFRALHWPLQWSGTKEAIEEQLEKSFGASYIDDQRWSTRAENRHLCHPGAISSLLKTPKGSPSTTKGTGEGIKILCHQVLTKH